MCVLGSPFGRKHCKIILGNNSESPWWGGLDLNFVQCTAVVFTWQLQCHHIPLLARPCLPFHQFMTFLPKSILELSSLNNFLN